MKEWHRTIVLVILLFAAMGLIVYTRGASDSALRQSPESYIPEANIEN